jgi:hypothetical protein
MAVPTSQEMMNLLERLRNAQRELIFAAAKATIAPSENTVRKVADLETMILAVEHTIEELKARPLQ